MATCRGIDVSAYQGTQDWASLRKDGLVFAFAKASEGQHSRDGSFDKHIAGILKAGLVGGGYHFAWPNQDVKAEAANYISAVKPYAKQGFTHWLDLERYSDGRNYSGRSTAQIRTWAAAWIAAVQVTFPGQRVGIYTSASDLSAGHVPAGVPLWYPAYPWGAAAYSKAEAAAQPKPSGRAPLIWQFTSQPVDRSIAYLSEAAFRAWASGTTEEDSVALTTDDIAKVADAVVAKLLAGGGALENSDLDRIWERDVIPAARPPYNNSDYYAADGKTIANDTWTATYATQTTVEGVRETLARVKAVQTALTTGGLSAAEIQAAAEAGATAALAQLGDKLQED
ncbi:glycoside hydrolase family 25 protein [Streptomyces sp. NPDC005423]|uniref:glycoside hydrolase family 25 protein n=1 Tax=Streptomyces sp. NPDC005423 TaxID=3155343 RepID=UPI0033B0CA38